MESRPLVDHHKAAALSKVGQLPQKQSIFALRVDGRLLFDFRAEGFRCAL